MKQMSLLLSIVAIAALLLAACGEANNQNLETTEIIDQTTLAPEATLPAEGDNTPIPETGSELNTTPTADAEAGADLDATPTLESTAVDETETPAVPDTGQAELAGQRYAQLSELIGAQVQDSSGQAVGQVTGVLIERPLDDGSLDDGALDSGAAADTPTPAVEGDQTDTTPTPFAEDGSEGSLMADDGPRILYVLVDLNAAQGLDDGAGQSDGAGQATATPDAQNDTATGPLTQQAGGTDVLIPFDAFDFSALAMDVHDATGALDSDNPQDDDLSTTPTPTQDDDLSATPTPSQDDDLGSGLDDSLGSRVIVLNATAEVAAGAPTLGEISPGAVSVPSWEDSVRAYWSENGFGDDALAPETGTDGAAQSSDMETGQTHEIVLIRDQIVVMDLVDDTGQPAGLIDDFVIDLDTGELAYAILTGQGALDGRMYLVPFSHLRWQGLQPSSDGFADPGGFTTDFPPGVMDPGLPWDDDDSDV